MIAVGVRGLDDGSDHVKLALEPHDMGGDAGYHGDPCWFLIESGQGDLATGFAQAVSPVMAESRTGLGTGRMASKAGRSGGRCGGRGGIGFRRQTVSKDMPVTVGRMERLA